MLHLQGKEFYNCHLCCYFSSRCVDVSSATPMSSVYMSRNLNAPSVMSSNAAYDTAVDEEAVTVEHSYETVP